VLIASRISKGYRRRFTLLSGNKLPVTAVKEVDLTIPSGAAVGLIGQSGSGKTTLARCIGGIERPDSGEVLLDGRSLFATPKSEFRALRRSIQLIFQDAAMAFNPYMTLEEIVAEPLRIAGSSSVDRRERSFACLEQVGLSSKWAPRRASELSGGQRRRLAIARALVTKPRVLILDEAVAGLDLLTQSHVIELLLRLRQSEAISYLFISHDLRLAGRVATDIAVMDEGRIVERGRTRDLLAHPAHPCTQALVNAVKPLLPAIAPSAPGPL
jgi:peptide/nickel transport system ATP-binding protein